MRTQCSIACQYSAHRARVADKHEHEVKIDDDESVLAWQFKTENHNIGFAVFRKVDNNAVSSAVRSYDSTTC